VCMDVKPRNDPGDIFGSHSPSLPPSFPPTLPPSLPRYLSMDVLKGLDLFKLSAGTEIPHYQAILGPNDIFGLGASFYECASRVPLSGGGPEFLALREGKLDHLPVGEVEEEGGREGGREGGGV